MSSDRKLVLDADGVIMSERPYWNAALATALEASDLAGLAEGRWDALADCAFGPLGLQRLTKGRGCNSNWDLASVLTRALENPEWRGAVREALSADRVAAAMEALLDAGHALWRSSRSDAADRDPDPLATFGIDRGSPSYCDVVRGFQQVMRGEGGIAWDFERWQLKESHERTVSALENFRDQDWELAVCTGRPRDEIERPIGDFGLLEFFPSNSLTTADEVDLAEARSGVAALGKPHWFSPACALVGFEAAVAALRNGKPTAVASTAVYVGDAWADFLAIEDCRRRSLAVDYVHMRSGVTTTDQEQVISGSPTTLAIVDRLAEIVPWLPGAGP